VLNAGPRRNKYGVAPKNQRTLDGRVFASKKEMNRYAELKMLERANAIHLLTLQPRYKLHAGIVYVADFSYWQNGVQVVEDVKGVRVATYLLKLRLFKADYPDLTHLET